MQKMRSDMDQMLKGSNLQNQYIWKVRNFDAWFRQNTARGTGGKCTLDSPSFSVLGGNFYLQLVMNNDGFCGRTHLGCFLFLTAPAEENMRLTAGLSLYIANALDPEN